MTNRIAFACVGICVTVALSTPARGAEAFTFTVRRRRHQPHRSDRVTGIARGRKHA